MQPSPSQDAAAEIAPARILLNPAKLLGGLPAAAAVATGSKQVGLKEIPIKPPQGIERVAA